LLKTKGIPLDNSCTNFMYKNEEISNPFEETELVHWCDSMFLSKVPSAVISFYDITIFDLNSEINSTWNEKKWKSSCSNFSVLCNKQ